MTNQLQGEVLFAGWAGSNGLEAIDWAYTPWLPARGDIATFGVEVTAVNSVTLEWEVQTRTAEDPASIAALVAGPSVSTVTTATVTNSTNKAKQLVRYRFKTGSSAAVSDYVVVRALQPSWQVNR